MRRCDCRDRVSDGMSCKVRPQMTVGQCHRSVQGFGGWAPIKEQPLPGQSGSSDLSTATGATEVGVFDPQVRASGPSGSEATKHLDQGKTPTMDHPTSGSGARWCAQADTIFDVPDMHVVEVEVDDEQRLVLTVESDQLEAACPTCGAVNIPDVRAGTSGIEPASAPGLRHSTSR
jgi:hypothetical protein